jgi:hypothetical protein
MFTPLTGSHCKLHPNTEGAHAKAKLKTAKARKTAQSDGKQTGPFAAVSKDNVKVEGPLYGALTLTLTLTLTLMDSVKVEGPLHGAHFSM